MFSIIISLEQHRKSEEKFKIFTSEKDESQVKVQAITKERDEFAKLALERGKALEVSQLPLVGLNMTDEHRTLLLHLIINCNKFSCPI